MNFHETTYGRRFFDAQLPHLTKALERIADGLTHTETASPQGIAPDPNFLHDLYYGDYEPSVFKAQSSRQKELNRRFRQPKRPCGMSCSSLRRL